AQLGLTAGEPHVVTKSCAESTLKEPYCPAAVEVASTERDNSEGEFEPMSVDSRAAEAARFERRVFISTGVVLVGLSTGYRRGIGGSTPPRPGLPASAWTVYPPTGRRTGPRHPGSHLRHGAGHRHPHLRGGGRRAHRGTGVIICLHIR